MKGHFWETQISSDIGPLNLKITYEIDPGDVGDYYQPTIPPSVNIIEMTVSGTWQDKPIDPNIVREFEEEIEIDLGHRADEYPDI